MKLCWFVDTDLIAENQPDLVNHIKSLGHTVIKLSATLDRPKFTPDPDSCYTFLGSFEELKYVQSTLGVPVMTYGVNKYIVRSGYISFIPNSWFLNESSVMSTWGQLFDNSDRFFNMFNADMLFVRPDSGNKTFTGQTFSKNKIHQEMRFLDRYSQVEPTTIIWVGEAKKIEKEYRVWISAGKVVTYSEYSWDKSPIEHSVAPSQTILDLAEQVASYEWQVDLIYTVDITEYDGAAKIIELNSFSCDGLYDCDGKKLLETVCQDIIAEWQD